MFDSPVLSLGEEEGDAAAGVPDTRCSGAVINASGDMITPIGVSVASLAADDFLI